MSYSMQVEQAQAVRQSRWMDRDDLLSTAMALFCIGMLVLDLFGLSNRWPWFGTLFYLMLLALVVLLPSNILLSIVTLKNNLGMAEERRSIVLPIFNLMLGLVQLGLLWQVASLISSMFGWFSS